MCTGRAVSKLRDDLSCAAEARSIVGSYRCSTKFQERYLSRLDSIDISREHG